MKAIVTSSLFCFSVLFFSADTFALVDLKQLERLAEDKIDIASVALDLAKEFYPKLDKKKYLKQIDSIAGRIEQLLLNGSQNPDYRIRAMNTVLFQELGFEYDLEDPTSKNQDNHFLNGSLDRKRGNCYTLPLLYMAVAHRLGYPVYAVSVPEHLFLRYTAKDFVTNIDPTGQGGWSPDDRYIKEFKITQESMASGAYMRTMTNKEFLAEMIAMNGAHWSKQGQFDRAYKYASSAIRLNEHEPNHHRLAADILNRELIKKRMTVTVYHPIGVKIHDHLEKAKQLGYIHLPSDEYLKNVADKVRRKQNEKAVNCATGGSVDCGVRKIL